MELCAHHVMVVACENANASARLPVPDTNGLIVRGTQHPRIFVMENSCANVVQVPKQREDASLLLIVPYFNLEVVATGYEKRLLVVKCDSSNGAVVLIELFQQVANAIVPQLNNAGV